MDNKILLNGEWLIDYLSESTYTNDSEPDFYYSSNPTEFSVTKCEVPGYFEDMLDTFRSTPLHTKLKWNPLYTLQRYPQAGYVPDLALPNPYGCFIYKRNFTITADELCDTAELYIGGVQNTVSAWINGKYLGRHEGYSSEFSFVIPRDALNIGENRITLTVSNIRLLGYKERPVSGLTSRAANECTGGIYGDVEIRFFKDGLRDIWTTVSDDISTVTVHTDGAIDTEKTVEIYDGEKLIRSAVIPTGETSVSIPTCGLSLWSPGNPKLYTILVKTSNQSQKREFGIRRLTVKGTKLYLNNEPYFFRGTCEHCYHPITVHPTREKKYYRNVIRTLKELGFNSIRFHTYVPMNEYMEAADELGMLLEIETPNNTTYEEWCDIVRATRHYTSPVIYSSGNEMLIDEDYIEHLRACANLVHTETDSLFSPMSAMRGIEYYSFGDCRVEEPFTHNPERLAVLGEFCDLYNSYSLGLTSYDSSNGDAVTLDYRNAIYKKPLLSHEIGIHGTYCDLSLKDRYRGSRIGDTELMSSVEKHLADRGLLDKANLYYRKSSEWQKILRKHCFETVRRSQTFAGYDFLGDIDTHWHTFGYCVGMMNEFYELKPGESVKNVLRYNSDTVLLADLPSCRNVMVGDKVNIPLLVSNYGKAIEKALAIICVKAGNETLLRREVRVTDIPCGEISELYTISFTVPRYTKPEKITIHISLFGGEEDCENSWDLYAFPRAKKLPQDKTLRQNNVIIADEMDIDTLSSNLAKGKNVVLFSAAPFTAIETSFQLSVAGRTNGHLATVIDDHPLMQDFPHDGFCAWQFEKMLNDGHAAVLDLTRLPHTPIIDIASSYKNAHREALLFEYSVGNGKLIVCTMNLTEQDPAANWLKERIVSYAMSEDFCPRDTITAEELLFLCRAQTIANAKNANEAKNINDITTKE